MNCPKCGYSGKQHTVDSRPRDWGVKRTRVCDKCNYKYSTIEVHRLTKEAIKSLDISQYLIDFRTNNKSED